VGEFVTATLVVVGWEKFQHYKDRDPPWIKLYRDLFTSESWVLGTDTSRLVQVASLLLAARYHNATPLQWNLVRKVANLDCTEKQFNEAIAHLVSTKFLEIQQVPVTEEASVQSASSVLATCASETEGEKSREEADKSARARARPSKRCPQEFQVTADLMAWAERKVPGVDVASETERFRDYEFKNPHSDWPATWREWMRKAAERGSNGARKPVSAPRPSAVERVRRATEKWLGDGDETRGGGVVIDG
jgi:hypothetical protein